MGRAEQAFLGIIAVAAIALVAPNEATGGIRCDGNAQIIGSGETHWSKHCALRQLANVARARGVATSLGKLKSSIAEREAVCNVVGFDTRVIITCNPYHALNRHEESQ